MSRYDLQPTADGVVAAIARPGRGARANSAIVALGGSLLVFDTGMTPQAGQDLRSAARRIGVVDWVVNSHWHGDHVRGNQAFDDVDILATTRTKALIESTAVAQMEEQRRIDWDAWLATAGSESSPPAPRLDKSRAARLDDLRELASTIDSLEIRPPTSTFAESLHVAGDCELVTLGAGHTESDAIAVLHERRVALVGDLVTAGMHPWLGAGDPDHWVHVLQELERLPCDLFVPGHGPVAGIEDVRAFRAHLESFLADPEAIESRYPHWDFWDDTADQNRAFLASRT